MDFIQNTPSNIDELVKQAGNKNGWQIRLNAVHELGKYNCQQSRDVLTRISLHDRVFKVKETAFRYVQALNIEKNGKPIRLGKKNIGYKNKDFIQTFKRVKREAKLDEMNLKVFKSKFKSVQPEMYDVMKYEKGDNFDKWIVEIYSNLPK